MRRSVPVSFLMPDRRLYSLLALAGAAPFVAAALLPLAGFEKIGPFGTPSKLALSYGLTIACFLAGVHWATRLYRQDDAPPFLLVSSNLVALAAWFAYLLLPTSWAIACLVLLFVYLWYVDFRLRGRQLLDAHYFRIRTAATGLVVLSLLTVLAAL